MPQSPLVSFVVPCYKFAHLLPKCVESILAQTYENFEVLIMDNCSPDNTAEVAQSFGDPRVKHIRNESNIGHVRNFNKGITMSRGKYVLLVPADDFLVSPHLLDRFVDVMEHNPHVAYVFCRAVELDGSVLEFTNCGAEDQIWNGRAFLQQLVCHNCIVMSSVMVRRECYEKISLFPLDFPYAGDWYLWSIFALHHHVAYISEPMVCWRIHEESLSSAFQQGDAPVCTIDELNVLSRVAREAELAGIPSLRRHCNASIANRTARALRVGPPGAQISLSESEFETIIGRNAKDSKDESDIRARIHIAIGDEQYWHGESMEAAKSYWLGLTFRPWWLNGWAKYLLLWIGGVGTGARQLLSADPNRRLEGKNVVASMTSRTRR